MMDLATLRAEYADHGLGEEDLQGSPLTHVSAWVQTAAVAGVPDANAMTLATVDTQGDPDARVVLLKAVEEDGLSFYTNRQSAKGEQLAHHSVGALVLYWPQLARQVRVRGPVTTLPRSDDEAYFAQRPRGSQLGAWASAQSRVVASRQALEALLEEATARFDGAPVPCPPYWGGYRLAARQVEFWQGRPNRLHDRILFTLVDGAWRMERLAS